MKSLDLFQLVFEASLFIIPGIFFAELMQWIFFKLSLWVGAHFSEALYKIREIDILEKELKSKLDSETAFEAIVDCYHERNISYWKKIFLYYDFYLNIVAIVLSFNFVVFLLFEFEYSQFWLRQDELLFGFNLLPFILLAVTAAVFWFSPEVEASNGLWVGILVCLFLYFAPSGLLVYWCSVNVLKLCRVIIRCS